MAMVTITSRLDPAISAVLTEPDEDGEYGWVCLACRATQLKSGYQPMEDAISNAEVHVENRCPLRRK
jgi:hypothetical protein